MTPALATTSSRDRVSREQSPEGETRNPLTHREAPLAMGADEFRQHGHALVDTIASFLASVPERPVTSAATPAQLQQALGADAALPETGMDTGALLQEAAALLFNNSLLNGHPRFFGYITSSPAPIGMLGDLLASAVNANVGSYRLGPMASEIEAQTVRWIAELVSYPSPCGGLLVSGGNMANMVGVFAARAAAAGQTVRTQGVGSGSASRLRIYASAETHTWLHKAADLAGLGTDAIRWITTDASLRLNVQSLRDAIAADRLSGDVPMMVVASAGTVSTGAVDPVVDIARVCREEGVWFHIDGAYGAFAATVPGVPADLTALGLADSVAVDPHKWLYAPLEAGCILVRNPDTLRDAFAYHPPYYHFGQEVLNYVDLGPQNSRGFRALKVWLAMRQVGRRGYAKMIADDIALRVRLHARLQSHPEFTTFSAGLSISTFAYVPHDLQDRQLTTPVTDYLDRLNAQIVDELQRGGEVFVSNAIIGGRYLLRACIVNFHTSAADIDAVPDIIARVGRRVDASLRSTVPSLPSAPAQ